MRTVKTDRYDETKLAKAPNKLWSAVTCWCAVWYLANVSGAAAAFKLTEEPVERVDMQLKQSVLVNQGGLKASALADSKPVFFNLCETAAR